ncbi:MAG TPA: hypothetical protein DDW80_06775 [Desulfovibrio sp.]|nr:hypothetical protein [Desulfovibrio sp.]
MIPYMNINGDSGVAAYEIRGNTIIVQFKRGTYKFYSYTREGIGAANFDEMCALANLGRGLNGFIRSNPAVREGYSQKW